MIGTPEHQFVVDAAGRRVAVILPIEEYEALVHQREHGGKGTHGGPRPSLFGALRHLGTIDLPLEDIDRARRELWGDWNQKEF